MKDIDWSEAPVGYPVWIESLSSAPSGWHRDDGDRYTGSDQWYWTKPEEGFYVVHNRPGTPQWNGTGLPPVGTVCECRVKANSPWVQCEVVAHHKQYAIAYVDDDTVMLSCGIRFRPIKTPEQIAADERETAIKALVDRFALHGYPEVPWYVLFQQMYDCGCRMTAEDER